MAASNIQNVYGSSQNHTITLAALNSSASLLAGRAGTAIDETATPPKPVLDEILAGFICTGTSPSAAEIDVYVYGSIDDTPTYPNGITGTDANVTMGSALVLASGLKLVTAMATDSTSNLKYPFGPISVASLFGGIVPKRWGVFVCQNTGVALNGTAANHEISSTPVFATVG